MKNLCIVLFFCSFALAQTGKVLHNFGTIKTDGHYPSGGLVSDAQGNLYGTTSNSIGGFGTVFELTPGPNGFWTETVLHNFSYIDGAMPSGTLVFDAAGNLYGATIGGGAGNGTGCSIRRGGCGTVFELSLGQRGWTETILHSFNWVDGSHPNGGLVFDASGNLYGTTASGGGSSTFYTGTVFELSPVVGGGWSHRILHTFKSGLDGLQPNGNLVFDASGTLYGTTFAGNGYVFELSPQSGGGWHETLLNITGTIGQEPRAGLTIDSSGSLYGTMSIGGSGGDSAVFELIPAAGGWTGTILYNVNSTNNQFVAGGVTLDLAGNVYGATAGTNCRLGCGRIFELTNSGGGVWTETDLFHFNGTNGQNPNGNLFLDSAGNVYGTTMSGGTKSEGLAFEITP